MDELMGLLRWFRLPEALREPTSRGRKLRRRLCPAWQAPGGPVWAIESLEKRCLLSGTLATASTSITSQFSFPGEYAVSTGGNGSQTLASITQNGNVLTLNGASTTTATITSATQILVNGSDTATYGNSSITFPSGTFAGQTWTQLNLPTDYTDPVGAAVHVTQNGPAVTFADKFGNTSPGTWISPTQLSAYGETVTIGLGTSTGQLLWADGTTWSMNAQLIGIQNPAGAATIVAVPNQIQVMNFQNGSGQPTYAISNGTSELGIIDSLGMMSVATFFNSTQATDPFYAGKTLTFSGRQIIWQDGTVWAPASNAGPSPPVVTSYTNVASVSTHVVKNSTNSAMFIDSLGTISVGTYINSTQTDDPQYPNDLATFGTGRVTWQDGSVWTQTAFPPIKITGTDHNGVSSHFRLQNVTSLVGLDGPLQGVIGTRVNNEIDWSNGEVWSNFEYGAINALFGMGPILAPITTT
jgi:hypothetical protein